MTYQSEVLADSPNLYYRLNDTSGTTIVDSSGNGHNGTYNGAPSLNESSPVDGGASVLFDGVDDYGSVSHNALMDIEEEAGASVECWVKLVADPPSAGTILGRPVTLSPTDIPYIIRRNSTESNVSGGYFSTVSGNSANADLFPITSRDWNHVVVTYESQGSGTRVKSYLNGTLVSTVDGSDPMPVRTSGFFIGAENNRRFVNCYLAEVALYPSTLSPTRIQAHYNAASSSGPTASVALTAPAATVSASATHTAPEYEASASLTAPSAVVDADATHTAPEFEASVGLTAPSPTVAASAAFDSGTFTASVGLLAPSAIIDAAATHAAPEYEASVSLVAPPSEIEATATQGTPEFTAAVAMTIGSVTITASANHEAPEFSASVELRAPPGEIEATALFAEALRTASVSLFAASPTMEADAGFESPVYTAAVSMVAPSAIISSSVTELVVEAGFQIFGIGNDPDEIMAFDIGA